MIWLSESLHEPLPVKLDFFKTLSINLFGNVLADICHHFLSGDSSSSGLFHDCCSAASIIVSSHKATGRIVFLSVFAAIPHFKQLPS